MIKSSATLLLAATVVLAPPSSANAESDGPPEATRAAELDPLVVGGTPVPAGKWRDAALIYFSSGPGCTGVLVAPDVVLTAGHCIGGVTQVKLAANNINLAGEVISVAREIEYPMSYRTYDLGVLVLSRESTIEPRVIATGCIKDEFVKDGADVAIVGYGATDANAQIYPDDLMEAFTTITDHDCSSDVHGCNDDARPEGELGAGGGGIDSCNGDSGGPLYLLTERGDYLVGITSRGYADSSLPCSQGGIYVRPDKIIEWIEEQSGRTLARATCNLEPVPSAEPIEVEAGDSADTLVLANDPDAADTHTFALAQAPEHGEVTTDADGTVSYSADADYAGEDSFAIAVTDNGDPNLTGTVVIPVLVIEAAGCCQASSGKSGNLLLFALVGLLLTYRRRRSS